MANIIEFKDNVPQSNTVLNGFYEVQKKQNRNGRFLKKYWKLLEFISFNIPEGIEYTVSLDNITKEHLHEILKQIQGVESVSFAKMTEQDFERHYSDTLDHCCKLLRVAPEVVIDELTRFF